ncbi:hypothetical protein N781_04630 [Pontibacillus halophilus JSM 076056 = DSM 19796]|uniref:Uncharacterized protein n=1 Tax=Pontibacillus halophilus JSM 076056 = DSM 19796 TaxID=1385510 RepID=A0A0A5GJL9_9BACI|nr:hypothetical protein [Pontibacillus halophilus]KGX91408.1 hypothetical protein N781_04630 [Pontibacillus halophilus JSM 076056 = DSM 19796]
MKTIFTYYVNILWILNALLLVTATFGYVSWFAPLAILIYTFVVLRVKTNIFKYECRNAEPHPC